MLHGTADTCILHVLHCNACRGGPHASNSGARCTRPRAEQRQPQVLHSTADTRILHVLHCNASRGGATCKHTGRALRPAARRAAPAAIIVHIETVAPGSMCMRRIHMAGGPDVRGCVAAMLHRQAYSTLRVTAARSAAGKAGVGGRMGSPVLEAQAPETFLKQRAPFIWAHSNCAPAMDLLGCASGVQLTHPLDSAGTRLRNTYVSARSGGSPKQ